MKLHTDRLTLTPLSPDQFALYLQNPALLEADMGLCPSGQAINASERQSLEWHYWMGIENPDMFLWYTCWQILLTAEHRRIGYACFQGPPAAPEHMVEFGYRIHFPYRRNGYMTEAARKLCFWALAQSNVKGIFAQTELGNYPSEGVLKHCGMKLEHTEDGIGRWVRYKLV